MTEQPDYNFPEQPEGDALTDAEPEAPEPEPVPEPVKKPSRKPAAKTKPAKTAYKPFHW